MTASLGDTTILVTSGPTRADIDAVRYISNRSSGRLGCRIATEALRRGAGVILLAGPQSATPADLGHEERSRLRVEHVVTVDDVVKRVEDILTGPDAPRVVVHAMAVLDYAPAGAEGRKAPSGRDEWQITLVPTPKVIRKMRAWAPRAFLVQFKLEVGLSEEELRRVALKSLRSNRADLVVANDLTQIRDEAHPALIMDGEGGVLARPATKSVIARMLCDLITDRLGG